MPLSEDGLSGRDILQGFLDYRSPDMPSPLERGRRVDQNIREYMDRHPEDADWFEEEDGDYTLNPAKLAGVGMPGVGPGKEERAATFEADKIKRDEILEAIYGGGTQTLEPSAQAESEVMEKEIPGMAISTDGCKTWKRK